jgi:hypothetical protein
MTEPRIELIPARPAFCSDESIVLDVLVRITPPLPGSGGRWPDWLQRRCAREYPVSLL